MGKERPSIEVQVYGYTDTIFEGLSSVVTSLLQSVARVSSMAVLASVIVSAQTFTMSEKVTALSGEWKRDPSRGTGSICGVREDDIVAFDILGRSPSMAIRTNRISGSVPLDGTSVSLFGQTVVATTDAGWLKLTMTRPRSGGGYANVMQEVYILNRDRNEMTLWRTLNTVLPDGSSGKIDCGNRAAVVYVRQPSAK
jgi:hypothetical protein